MWYLLLNASDEIMKKYPDPIATRESDRPNLVKVYDWPDISLGLPERKCDCKIAKAKKTIKDKEGRDITIDGEISKKAK